MCAALADFHFQDVVLVADLERVTVPFFGQDGVEREHPVLDAHTAKSLNDSHPRAAHRGNVAAVAGVVVVVVEVEARGVEVELISLVVKPDLRREDVVDATRQRTLVNRELLVKLKIALDGLHVKIVLKEINSLQNVRLFDVATPQNPVPRPMLIDWAHLRVELRNGNQLLVQEAVVLDEDLAFFIVTKVHFFDDVAPFFSFVLVEIGCLTDSCKIFGIVFLHEINCKNRVLHILDGGVRGVPIVVDIVFV